MKIKTELSMPELIEESRLISNSVHRNAMYGIYPYEKHITDVRNILIDHGYGGYHLIGANLHDCIEDGSLTWNKIFKTFGLEAAEIVLAVTDPSDERDRKAKKTKVIAKILAYPLAAPTKVADRIANFVMGIREKNYSKLKMYVGEHEEFYQLKDLVFPELWDTLENCVIQAHSILISSKSKV